MKIYDISQEVLSCQVYEGDPHPELSFTKQTPHDLYNLSKLCVCNHNGTHIDAPLHFIHDGKSISQISLEKCIGKCSVISRDKLETLDEFPKKILVKGNCDIDVSIAKKLNRSHIDLIGSETQSIGPEKAPMAVHLELLGNEVVLLEGIRLDGIDEGDYFLFAAPLNVDGAEGSLVRAILIDFEGEKQ